MELQTGEIPVEISVDDLRLRIWEIIRPWNLGVIIGDRYSIIIVLAEPKLSVAGTRVLRRLADDEWDFFYQTRMVCFDSAI